MSPVSPPPAYATDLCMNIFIFLVHFVWVQKLGLFYYTGTKLTNSIRTMYLILRFWENGEVKNLTCWILHLRKCLLKSNCALNPQKQSHRSFKILKAFLEAKIILDAIVVFFRCLIFAEFFLTWCIIFGPSICCHRHQIRWCFRSREYLLKLIKRFLKVCVTLINSIAALKSLLVDKYGSRPQTNNCEKFWTEWENLPIALKKSYKKL